MTKLLTTCLALLFAATVQAQSFETATQAVGHMGLGWNLGNTLDANNNDGAQQGLDSETCWGQPYTKPELLTMMKQAGFGAVRVPVTWMNHMDTDGKVNADWMARVKEVVGYVLDAGLYCILNVHHDTGEGSVHWMHASTDTYNSTKTKYEYLWQQIAEEFKDYDEHLLFESYNEMLDKYNSWCFATFNTDSRYIATDAADAYEAINSYAQSFVTTVRATGSNNAQRNLVVNTYGACCGGGTWNEHLKDPLKEMKLPSDPSGTGHIIFQVHCYPSIVLTDNDGKVTGNRPLSDIKAEIDDIVSALNTHLVAKGAPVIIGEWGTSNVDKEENDYQARRSHLFDFASYFVQKMKENNIGTFYWMGLSDGAYRAEPIFSQADLAKVIVEAYHGSSDQYVFPTIEDKGSITCFEGEKALDWGNGITISNSLFTAIGNTVQLELTYTVTGSSDDIQLYYGGWSAKPSFIVEGKTYAGDFNPSKAYGSSATIGTTRTSVFTFSESVYNELCQKGLIIHGNDITLTKAVLVKPSASGISATLTSPATDNTYYDLSGRRVQHPTKGIYIHQGHKVVM